MHDIEPHFRWRDQYIASEDQRSPFFRRRYSEFEYSHQLYNFFLHPQWDEFGSSTLYCKILYTEYEQGYTLIELIGEWNDTLHNDIMYLKRNVAEKINDAGGWIVLLNTRLHVEEEMQDSRLDNYLHFGELFNDIIWQAHKPANVMYMVEALLQNEEKRLHG